MVTNSKKHAETADTADVRAMLAERGAVYGDFTSSCMVDAGILDAMNTHHFATHHRHFTTLELVVLSKITHKLARIAGTFDHLDSWRDLAAYATLIADSMESSQQEVPY